MIWKIQMTSESLYSYNFWKNTSHLVEESCKELSIWQKPIFMTVIQCDFNFVMQE